MQRLGKGGKALYSGPHHIHTTNPRIVRFLVQKCVNLNEVLGEGQKRKDRNINQDRGLCSTQPPPLLSEVVEDWGGYVT